MKIKLSIIFCFSILLIAKAQDKKPKILELSGYVKEMPSFYFLQNEIMLPSGESLDFLWYNLIHNRLNFSINPFENFKVEIGMRNRLLGGAFIKNIPQYADVLSEDNGLVDMSWNVFHKNAWVMNTSFDRVYLDYTIDKVQIKLGRQRVNWGIGLVWNPNDIFNAFSYIDFDYEERPGSDAIAVTWYRSATSSLDIVGKIVKTGHAPSLRPDTAKYQTTIAARYLFNAKNTDFQFIAGKFNDDLVGGFGWSGAIKNVSFRGEMSLFVPVTTGKTVFVGTVEADYSFSNSLYLHGAVLFNSSGELNNTEGMNLLATSNDLSAKKLSYGKFELFGNISYPVNPIFTVSLATMFNPVDLSAYISPNATVSLQDNLELALVVQLLAGKENTEYAAMGDVYAGFARLKWSF